MILFYTSGSSPYNDSGIKNPAEDATWVSDRRFSSGADQDTVADWVSLRELENG